MRGGWRIGRIGGVEVRIESSLLFLAGLITYDLWLFFSDDRQFPELRSPMALVLALLTALLFVGSILAHELAHAAAFRARGIEVRGITLYMFGGLTAAKSEARRPWDEFLVTVEKLPAVANADPKPKEITAAAMSGQSPMRPRWPELRSATTATPCRVHLAMPSCMACSPMVWPNPNCPSTTAMTSFSKTTCIDRPANTLPVRSHAT